MWTYLRNIRLSHQKATRHYINQDVESVRLYAHRIIDCLIDLSDKDKLIFIDCAFRFVLLNFSKKKVISNNFSK